MYKVVMAVFPGTEMDEALFQRALDAAVEDGARLVLLNVRHLQQAQYLGEYLYSEAFMGRGAVESLKRSVKAQRNQVVSRSLSKVQDEARRAGVEVQVREVKGDYVESVLAEARRASADLVVVEDSSETEGIAGDFDVLRVRARRRRRR